MAAVNAKVNVKKRARGPNAVWTVVPDKEKYIIEEIGWEGYLKKNAYVTKPAKGGNNKNGKRWVNEVHRCRHKTHRFPGCNAKIRLNSNTGVIEWSGVHEHDPDKENKQPGHGLPLAVKQEIDALRHDKRMKPKKAFLDLSLNLENKGLDAGDDFSLAQVRNYFRTTRGAGGEMSDASVGWLVNWCQTHTYKVLFGDMEPESVVAEYGDIPYVEAYHIPTDAKERESLLQVTITTPWLAYQLHPKHRRAGTFKPPLMYDYTFATNYNRWPMGIAALCNVQRRVIPVLFQLAVKENTANATVLLSSLRNVAERWGFNIEDSISFGLSDGGHALWAAWAVVFPFLHHLMCFFHILESLLKSDWLALFAGGKKNENLAKIKVDVSFIGRKCRDIVEWNAAVKLFFKRWEGVETLATNKMLQEWFSPKKHMWSRVFVEPGHPISDILEQFNKSVKDEYTGWTMGEAGSIQDLLENAGRYFQRIRLEFHKDPFPASPYAVAATTTTRKKRDISLWWRESLLVEAEHFVKEGDCTYYHFKQTVNALEMLEAFTLYKEAVDPVWLETGTMSEFKKRRSFFYCIRPCNNWFGCTCDCYTFGREGVCPMVLFHAVRNKVLEIPAQYDPSLQCKLPVNKKPGKKAKASKRAKSKAVVATCANCNNPGHNQSACRSMCRKCQGMGHTISLCPNATYKAGSRASKIMSEYWDKRRNNDPAIIADAKKRWGAAWDDNAHSGGYDVDADAWVAVPNDEDWVAGVMSKPHSQAAPILAEPQEPGMLFRLAQSDSPESRAAEERQAARAAALLDEDDSDSALDEDDSIGAHDLMFLAREPRLPHTGNYVQDCIQNIGRGAVY